MNRFTYFIVGCWGDFSPSSRVADEASLTRSTAPTSSDHKLLCSETTRRAP
jgi:hypothetical protein